MSLLAWSAAGVCLALAVGTAHAAPLDEAIAACRLRDCRQLQALAEADDPDAQFALGNYLVGQAYLGDLQKQDVAVIWYRKAASKGHTGAQYILGLSLIAGIGAAKDAIEGLRWLRSAAEGNYAEAQEALGGSYYHGGEATPRDLIESEKWDRLAAQNGREGSLLRLGFRYSEGIGVPTDAVEAARWYRDAADLGSREGQYRLGNLYANGRGVALDQVQAYKWFHLAAEGPQAQYDMWGQLSANARDLVASSMTSQQVAEARRLADEWKPRR